MVTKKDLKHIEQLRKEISYFNEKIEKINKKPVKIVKDSVKSSSAQFPYTEHSAVIEGFENPKNLDTYKYLLINYKEKLETELLELEKKTQDIEDSEIRQIIRWKYQENLTWVGVMFQMGYNCEETPRMKLDRYLRGERNE